MSESFALAGVALLRLIDINTTQIPFFLVEYLSVPRDHHALISQIQIGDRAGGLFHVKGEIVN